MDHSILGTILKNNFFCALLAFSISNIVGNIFQVGPYQEVNLVTDSFLGERRLKVLHSFLFPKSEKH